MAKSTTELELLITAKTAGLNRRLDAVDKKLGGISKRGKQTSTGLSDAFSGLGANLSKAGIAAGAAAAAFGLLKSSIGNAIKLDQELRNIGTLGVENFEAFGDKVLEISKRVPQDALSITQGVYQAISAGVSEAEAAGFVEVAAKTATAGLSDTKTAVDALTTATNAFASSGLTAEQAADTMFTTVRLGKTNFEEIATNLATASSMASNMGVSFESMNAAVATSTTLGVPTAQAFTQIQGALTALAKGSTAEMDQLFNILDVTTGKELIQKFGSLQGAMAALNEAAGGNDQMLTKAFGRIEGYKLLLNLTGENAAKAAQHLDEMGSSAGAMGDAFEVNGQSMANRMKLLENNWDAITTKIGQILMPVVEHAVNLIMDWFNKLDQLSEAVEDVGDFFSDAWDTLTGSVEETAKVTKEANTQFGISNLFAKNFQDTMANLNTETSEAYRNYALVAEELKAAQEAWQNAESAAEQAKWAKEVIRLQAEAEKLSSAFRKNTKKAGKDAKTLAEIIQEHYDQQEQAVLMRRLFGEPSARSATDALDKISQRLTSMRKGLGDVALVAEQTANIDFSFTGDEAVAQWEKRWDKIGEIAAAGGMTVAASLGSMFNADGTEDAGKELVKAVGMTAINMVQSLVLAAAAASTAKAIPTFGASLITDAPWLAAAYAGLEVLKGFVGSFEQGSMFIPQDGFAQLHRGERVLTREQNEQYERTGRIAGQGGRSNRMGKKSIKFKTGAFGYEVGYAENALVEGAL